MDLYTKVILTVIAIALSVDVVERTTKPAQAAAASGVSRSAILSIPTFAQVSTDL
jgi:hypothetical protein